MGEGGRSSVKPLVFHPPFGCGEGLLDKDIGVVAGSAGRRVGVAGIVLNTGCAESLSEMPEVTPKSVTE